jgi:uncharacterized repeat protein (TIGR03803 family)
LYGITHTGGKYNQGVLFELDPATGGYFIKIDFSNAPGGLVGVGSLSVYGAKLYGIGGVAGINGIFEWDPSTNLYTNRADFPASWGPGASSSLILAGSKFYGVTLNGGLYDAGVLFEWDPVSNVLEKKLDFTGLQDPYPSPYESALAAKDGQLYGVGLSGGALGLGVIFEWDPGTNTYTKKFDFGGNTVFDPLGSSPFSGLTLCGRKFYGMTLDGGLNGLGVFYEWDPLTNIYVVKQDLDGENTGRNPMSKLGSVNGRLYGMPAYGGKYDKGLLFEFDTAMNTFTKKLDFDGANAGNSVEGNTIIGVPSPVADGLPGQCVSLGPVTIDNSNNNVWVPVVDNAGNAVAEIKGNGNNLGNVTVQIYVNDSTAREDQSHRLYLDRNFTITPQTQPSTTVDVRLYIKNSELEALKAAVNSLGKPSGISTIDDLAIFRTENGCEAPTISDASSLATTNEKWPGGYVLSASVNSFSSFYFSNKASAPLPITLLEFKAHVVNRDAILSWTTENETNSSHVEIERSSDGHNFHVVGTLPSVNTPEIHNYHFTDFQIDTIHSARIYYRLKLVDIDGKFSYSQIVIASTGNRTSVSFFPNPVADKANLVITLQSPEEVQLRIMDNLGRVVKLLEYKLAQGTTPLAIDAGSWAKGTYILEIKGTSFSKQIVFVK